MTNALEEMAYPGRGIVIGNNINGEIFAAYFVTGRSPSSQARRLGEEGNMIFTEPTDPEVLATGNPDLLIYNAILWDEDTGTLAVSNGKQTDTVFSSAICSRQDILEATRQWNYEPDKPNFTPRISGYIGFDGQELVNVELGIISYGGNETAIRDMFDMTHELKEGDSAGLAFLLTTYKGGNESPLLPFEGEPKPLGISGITAGEICEELGNLIDPALIVSVGAVRMLPAEPEYDSAVRNYRT